MQESEKLKVAQNLARAVAHEFRQPLSTLSLIDDLVRMEEEGRLEEHTLQRMRNAINRIDGLVEKLLTITRLESIPYAMGLDMVDLERSSQREGSLPAEPDGENDLY
jgi:signal transduction histidine kinase